MTVNAGQSSCRCEKKETDTGELNVVCGCIHRMYYCLMAIPVLSLMGAVILLSIFSGNFEEDSSRFQQVLRDLRLSSKLLNITKHISEETALSHAFWVHQSEEARLLLHARMTVTDQLLQNASKWLPETCVRNLRFYGDSDGLYQRFLRARSGVEFNETPLALDRELFEEFVLNVAVCPLADVSNSLLRNVLESELVYYHRMAASVSFQHLVIQLDFGCRFAPWNASLDESRIARAGAHIRFVDFLTTKEMAWLNEPFARVPRGNVCSEDSLANMTKSLNGLIGDMVLAQDSLQARVENLLNSSDAELAWKSCCVVGAVVALSVALYVFSSASQRSREMAQAVNMMVSYVGFQSEKKDVVLNVCMPRLVIRASPSLLESAQDENIVKVSAAVLALEIPGLSHVMQAGDCSAALCVMTHILTLMEEKAHKHQCFVLQQQAASCQMAAVSNSTRLGSLPLTSVADLALDLMTSLTDVELTLTSDGGLKPRFGLHSGPALGFVGDYRPAQYRLVGNVAQVAMKCQELSEPNCIRLSWETNRAIQQLDQYIIVESDSGHEECLSPTRQPVCYLAGKRTFHDHEVYHVGCQGGPHVVHYV